MLEEFGKGSAARRITGTLQIMATSRQKSKVHKGDERAQARHAQERLRQEGEESQASGRHRDVGIRPIEEAQEGQLTRGQPSMPLGGSVAKETDDPLAAARSARLRYVTDGTPGISRSRAASGFDYRDPDGHLIGDLATLSRIKSLAIPPAWVAVWICRFPNGHIQAKPAAMRGDASNTATISAGARREMKPSSTEC